MAWNHLLREHLRLLRSDVFSDVSSEGWFKALLVPVGTWREFKQWGASPSMRAPKPVPGLQSVATLLTLQLLIFKLKTGSDEAARTKFRSEEAYVSDKVPLRRTLL